ncbi:MAG: NACHT domain-containing protein [Deltaproteobacteria bacterium]|nr:NACHT domain-containing protein [Myxococcales bacterium]MDP3215835.1 NACHT domain-containing protein [Deltaproteobacteria bacterium]
MSDTLDVNEVAAALGELRRLVHRLDEVRAGFGAIAAAADLSGARERAFGLSADVPEVRVFGVLDRVTEQELHALVSAATPDIVVQRDLGALLEMMRRAPRLHRAMAHVHPYSFTPVGGEWWEQYRAELRALPEQPIWGIPEPHRVPLKSIYVAPRYRQEVLAGTVGRRVGIARREDSPIELDPQPMIRRLVSDSSGSRANLVFVLGGPGSGKSTLATMLASELADDALLQPLLIRLREVSPERDLFQEIARALPQVTQSEAVGSGLAEVFERAPRLVLLLDGFDELIQASRSGLGSFFLRLQGLLREQRVQGLVCFGRDTVFGRDDTAIPEGAKVVTLLPFDDAQVATWCARWRDVTGSTFDCKRLEGSGEESDAEVLRSLIHEPLTLRLLALLDLEGIQILDDLGGLDLTRIYRHVISETCKRHQSERGDFTAAELRRLLRVIGFAVMQSGREVIRSEDLQRTLAALGLQAETEKTESKATRLILAISQRRSEQDERAWEFLHKSLGEYLAAEFLSVEIAAMVSREKDEFGETTFRLPDSALRRRWIERFGVAVVPVGVERFLKRMAGDWPTFVEHGVAHDADRDLVTLAARLGAIYGGVLDEFEAETTLRVARAWSLRPSDVLGISLGNVFLIAGLRAGQDVGFAPEQQCPGRYREAYHGMMRSPAFSEWERISSQTLFVGIADGSDLSNLNLGHCIWNGVNAKNVVIQHSQITLGTISRSTFLNCNFYMTEIAGCTVIDSSFDHCWLAASSLQFSRLRNVTFTNCAFHRADLADGSPSGFPFKTIKLPHHAVVAIEKKTDARRSFTIP